MSDSTQSDITVAVLTIAGAYILDLMWRQWCKSAARKLRAEKSDKYNLS